MDSTNTRRNYRATKSNETTITKVVRSQGDKPVVRGQGDKPVVRGQGDKPVVRGQGDRPVVRSQGDRPVVRSQGDRPVVVRGQNARKEGQIIRGQRDSPDTRLDNQRIGSPGKKTVPRPKSEEKLELPLIYKTDIPLKLATELVRSIIQEKQSDQNPQNFLENPLYNNFVLMASTGFGKTVMANAVMAEIKKQMAEKNINIECTSIMPFRVSVIEMCEYLNKLFPQHTFGYAMRGDNRTSPIDSVRLNTVGYWLEKTMTDYRLNGLPKTHQIVMVDEAHDATWQTDLALRLLLWLQKQGAPIKIIVTSATLDVEATLKSAKVNPLILSVEDNKANVDIHYLENFISAEERGKLTNEMYAEITKKLLFINGESDEGDILIMLPGQDEIMAFIELLEKNAKFNEFVILPLYSAMAKEEIEQAIKPNPEGKRKIICSTNIVENAITIDNLMFVIDCCYRKVSEIDSDGVQQLVLRQAARSNMTQALGRVGRQGKRGTAYLMVTEREFSWRQAFSENEVQRNPLYLQIIKLVRDGLPVCDVLCHVEPFRIERDTKFLIMHGALEQTSEGIVVTNLGKIMAQLPLSIRAAHFLALAITTLESSLWYSAIVAAAWMDNGASVFFRPGRKPREEASEYDARIQIVQEVQEQFFKKDCLSTALNVWFSSWTIPEKYKGGFHGWCKDNGIFDRTLKDIGSSVNHIISSLEGLKFVVTIPSKELCQQYTTEIEQIIPGLIPVLEIAYKDWIFIATYGGDYCREGFTIFNGLKYNIDKFLRNDSVVNGDLPMRVMALSLKKIAPNRIIMSNLVNLKVQQNALLDPLADF